MATQIDSNPFPLGFIGTEPGHPVNLLKNYPDLEYEYANLILIQAHPDNAGRCFIGNRRLDVLTGEGLIYTLMSNGDAFVLSNMAQNVYRLEDFMIDVEFPGDGVVCSVYIR